MKFFAAVGVVATALLASTLSGASAQTALAELRSPPAGAQHFIIGSTGGKHGDDWIWTGSDGATYGRQSLNLRGQVWEQDVRETFGADHMLSELEIRGVTPQGDAPETFAIAAGQATWRSPIDTGSAAYARPALYVATGNAPIAALSLLVERVIAEPTKTLALLPGGQVTAERLTSIQVGEGARAKTVTAWALSGLGTTPIPVWTDEQGRFFGISLGLFWLPAGYENDHAQLEQAQSDALAARMPDLYRRLVRVPDRPVAFTHVRLYDADAVRFVPDQTVVVQNGRITAVGPANTVRVPRNAEIIDGAGKTLIPGLWDCHMHVGDDYTGVQELSLGVTSVRDPGNNDVRTMDRRTRIGRNELLFPNVYPSSLIDG